MKQRITVEQLNELDGSQLNKLNNSISTGGVIGVVTDELLEKLAGQITIGQMIELLDPEEKIIFTMCKYIGAVPRVYQITVNGTTFYGETMCDTLWEAVKATL